MDVEDHAMNDIDGDSEQVPHLNNPMNTDPEPRSDHDHNLAEDGRIINERKQLLHAGEKCIVAKQNIDALTKRKYKCIVCFKLYWGKVKCFHLLKKKQMKIFGTRKKEIMVK